MSEKKQQTFGIALAAGAAFLLWLLSKKGLLHESVTSQIVTGQGTITSDPATGAPNFSTADTRTYNPAQYAAAIPPISGPGPATQYPSNPQAASCPEGYQLWHNVDDNSYWCMPV